MENTFRLREKQLNIRATEYEYEQIMKQFKASGKSTLREFVIESAINGYIINVDYTEIKQLAYEVNRIGNNINQVAHKINSENQIYKEDMQELQEDMDLLWRMIRKAFYQMNL